MRIKSITIRRSPVGMIAKIILVAFVLLIISVIVAALHEYGQITSHLPILGIFETDYFLLFSILFVQLITTLYFFLDWHSTSYIVKKDEVMFKHGLFRKNEDTYPLKNIQAIYAHQNFIGRMLNYGKICLHSPLTQEDIRIDHVCDVHNCADIIKNALQHKEGENVVPIASIHQ